MKTIGLFVLLAGSAGLIGNSIAQEAADGAHSAESVVQGQLEAYNARDIDRFVTYFAEDVKVYEYPDTLAYQGRDALRSRYAALFEKAPELHAEIVDRIVAGNTVIDSERVTAGGPRALEAVAVYRVKDGLIESVMFLPTD